MCNKIKILLIIVIILLLSFYFYKNNNKEHYAVKSSAYDVSQGSSMKYGWGYPEDDSTKKTTKPKPKPPHCPPHPKCPSEQQDNNCKPDYDGKCSPAQCKVCDITLNKDIDKYVLKSSIPPYPNMSEYVKKSMLPPQINMNEYIHKSKIPPCKCPPKPDLSKYVLKADVPGCPKCPQIPKCPICPLPKKISDYDISSHPDFKHYKHKDQCTEEVKKLREELEKQIQQLKSKAHKVKHNIQNRKQKFKQTATNAKNQIYNFKQDCNDQTPPKPVKQCY